MRDFASLQKIAADAWSVVATTIRGAGLLHDDDGVADGATTVAFTEGLLRSILSLRPDQQTELVRPSHELRAIRNGAPFLAFSEGYARMTPQMGVVVVVGVAKVTNIGYPI